MKRRPKKSAPSSADHAPGEPKAEPGSKNVAPLYYRLTPSEIESLRQDKKRTHEYMKGKFLHLK